MVAFSCSLAHFRDCGSVSNEKPFLDCGGYSRWEQQMDGCRATRAALRRVEYPGQGGEGTQAALQRVGFSAQELDCCSVRWRGGFPTDAGHTTGSRCFLDCQTPRRYRHGVDVQQPLSTASTSRIWCCTPSGMVN